MTLPSTAVTPDHRCDVTAPTRTEEPQGGL